MIKLIDVEKVYESGAGKTWVLRRINLEIRDGDFVTIMGPSGAGKSTLMGIIGMLDGAWKGEYYLLENAVRKLDNRRRVELLSCVGHPAVRRVRGRDALWGVGEWGFVAPCRVRYMCLSTDVRLGFRRGRTDVRITSATR